jgi:hypothetical protein
VTTDVPAVPAAAEVQVQPVAPTNPPAAVEPASPAFKLQAILYNPTRPSVMINSRTLFIGDRINEYHVTEIHRDSATLTGSDPTNVLILATGR